MNEQDTLLGHLLALPRRDRVLATLVAVAGSSYRRPGARLLLTSEGLRVGSISGGCLEEDVLSRAHRVMVTGVPELITYDTTSENDLIWGVGLGCHGVVKVLLEKVPSSPEWVTVAADNLRANRPTLLRVVWLSTDGSPLGTTLDEEYTDSTEEEPGVFHDTMLPPVRLAIFGAGDDAQPLCRIAKEMGWHVTIADPRSEFATPSRFPGADAVVTAPASVLVSKAAISEDSVAVVMTHHYVHDVPILKALLLHTKSYIGLLGPRKRAEKILQDLATGGVVPTLEEHSRLFAPVGFDLGAESAAEVALSMIAEIQAFLKKRDGRPLRARTKPIHEAFQPSFPSYEPLR